MDSEVIFEFEIGNQSGNWLDVLADLLIDVDEAIKGEKSETNHGTIAA